MNRAARRKQQQELQRMERQRKRAILRVSKSFMKKSNNGYITEEQSVQFLQKLYGGK